MAPIRITVAGRRLLILAAGERIRGQDRELTRGQDTVGAHDPLG
jgi:hypothetical protein